MAKVKEFKTESGVSFERNGVWYKFHCGITVETNENDNLDEIKEKAWNTVHDEITKQIEELDKGNI